MQLTNEHFAYNMVQVKPTFREKYKKMLVMHFCSISHPKNLKAVKGNYSLNCLFGPVPKGRNKKTVNHQKKGKNV